MIFLKLVRAVSSTGLLIPAVAGADARDAGVGDARDQQPGAPELRMRQQLKFTVLSLIV